MEVPMRNALPRANSVVKYGADHRRLRRQIDATVKKGFARCARCGELIDPNEPWDLGHNDNDPTSYNGPEHRRCNRQTSTHRIQPSRTSRSW
jgi:hypothetical protein